MLCHLHHQNNSLFSVAFQCQGDVWRYIDYSSQVKKNKQAVVVPGNYALTMNEDKNLEKTTVLSLGKKSMQATANLKLRSGPGVNTASFLYIPFQGKVYKTITKGTKLTAIARTTGKAQVGYWRNYWYYIQ